VKLISERKIELRRASQPSTAMVEGGKPKECLIHSLKGVVWLCPR